MADLRRFSALIQSPKDFALRQGGKRRDERSIHKYVTDTRESSQRSMSAKDTGRAQRICLAALARWSHLTPCRTQ
ncbi:hypothetical protein FD828_28735, partial [Klebsiella pneumoniae]|nr:hypothetical protein [Klebsiella pneumoniae]